MSVASGVVVNNIICQLSDNEGNPLGKPVDLPQNVGPLELHALVNSLLNNVSAFLSIAMFIGNIPLKLTSQLHTYHVKMFSFSASRSSCLISEEDRQIYISLRRFVNK